jgi:hypothetical protein
MTVRVRVRVRVRVCVDGDRRSTGQPSELVNDLHRISQGVKFCSLEQYAVECV